MSATHDDMPDAATPVTPASAVDITHVVENLARGGLERVVIDLALAQREAGHRCRVVCLFERGALADELSAHGIEVDVCGKRRTGVDPAALLRARRLLRRQRGGVLHTHNATAHYHAVLAAAGLGFARVVNTRHGMGDIDPRSRRERLYRIAMRATDHVVAVCAAARERLAGSGVRPREALLSIPNGIHVDRFAPADADARARLASMLDLPRASRMVGTVGRLHRAKDQASLIRAFARLLADVPDAALVLVGDGALRGELEQLARSEGVAHRVRLLGDRGDVAELLRGLELFALPSLTEGYSVALLEACAAGLPIVATDVGGNCEIVRHGVNGLLVPARDIDALAAAMSRVLGDAALADAMARAGRAWVLAEGSLQRMRERYAALYVDRAEAPA